MSRVITYIMILGLAYILQNVMVMPVYAALPPQITSFGPSSGVPGEWVEIYGHNFLGLTNVAFNGTSADVFNLGADGVIRTKVPMRATTGRITVTTTKGTDTSGTDFVINVPIIISFTPTSGKLLQPVTIYGKYFINVTEVSFNGTTQAGGIVTNYNSIASQVPLMATTGKITVTTDAGKGTSATDFIVEPVIDSFSPTSGGVGQIVRVTGVNFLYTSAVLVNGKSASYTVRNNTSIDAMIPAVATSGKITVTNVGGSYVSQASFTVVPTPSIKSFLPISGRAGQEVTVSGANLTGATAVQFNGKAAVSFVVNSSSTITATVSGAATTGRVSVTNAGGTAISNTDFTFVPSLASLPASIYPGSGYVGPLSRITINYSLDGPKQYSGKLVLDNTGKSTLNGIEIGKYDLGIYGNHWLVRMITGLDVNGKATVNTDMTNGDADGNNQVNLFDFVMLDTNFGYASAMADLNGDGIVNLFDYVIIDQNFGAWGD